MGRKYSRRLQHRNKTKKEETLNKTQFVKTVVLFRTEQYENEIPYLKLINDCWFRIFCSLHLRDILNLSKTNQHMKAICGFYLSLHHSNLHFQLSEAKVCTKTKYLLRKYKLQFDFGYSQYIGYLIIDYNELIKEENQTFFENPNHFISLKTLSLRAFLYAIHERHIKILANLLQSVESLKLNVFYCCCAVYKRIASLSHNLKNLHVNGCMCGDAVFRHRFQELQHLKYIPFSINADANPDLRIFLMRHKNLVHFTSDVHFFWANRIAFVNTRTKFNEFTLIFTRHTSSVVLGHVVDLLTILRSKGKIQWLNLSFDQVANSYTEPWVKHIDEISKKIPVKKLTLHYQSLAFTSFLAKSLTQIEEITFKGLPNKHHTLFVLQSKYLKKMLTAHSRHPVTCECFSINCSCYNVSKLNSERAKLDGARPILWFMHQEQYLDVTRDPSNLGLSHIILKRLSNF